MNNNDGFFYNGKLLSKSIMGSLSEDLRGWLEFYNSLSPDEQDTITFDPLVSISFSSDITILTEGKTVVASDNRYDTYGYPIYNSNYWNEKKDKANCYAYAMNVLVENGDFKLRPGNVRDFDMPAPPELFDKIASLLAENVISDCSSGKMGKITDVICCRFADIPNNKNQYRVALVLGYNKDDTSKKFRDYHWYREDSGGTWSHKRGAKEVSNVDSNNIVISNEKNPPHLCAREYSVNYDYFATYFMITHE